MFHRTIQPGLGIEFAYQRNDGHTAALHLFKLAFEERQTVIGPAIDQIRNRRWPEHGAMPCVPTGDVLRRPQSSGSQTRWAHRLQVYVPMIARGTLYQPEQWRDSVFNSEMLLNPRPPGTAVTQSQFSVAQQLLKGLGQRERVLGRNQYASLAAHH